MKTKVSFLIATIISVAFFSCKPKYSMVFHGSNPSVQHKIQETPVKSVEKVETIADVSENTPKEVTNDAQKPSVKEVIVAAKAVKQAQKSMPQASTLNKEMSKSQKKVMKAKMKEQIKEMKKANKTNGGNSDVAFILTVILAILLPPVGVAVFEGITGRFWIDLLLWLGFWVLLRLLGGIGILLWLASLIYALLIIFEII